MNLGSGTPLSCKTSQTHKWELGKSHILEHCLIKYRVVYKR